jgi:hypothetical protein
MVSRFDYDAEGNVIGHWRYQPELAVTLTDNHEADSSPHTFLSDLYRVAVPGGLKLTGVSNRIGKRIDGMVGEQTHPVDEEWDHEEYYLAESGHLLLEFDAQRRLVRHSLNAQAVDHLMAV